MNFLSMSVKQKKLFVSRPTSIKSGAFSPCDMTPDDVDYEMTSGKHPEILEICGMNQKSLEYFVRHCTKSYRSLSFFKCQLIRDFSPLEDLLQHQKRLDKYAAQFNALVDKYRQET